MIRFLIILLLPVWVFSGEYDAKSEARLNRGYYLEYKKMPSKKAEFLFGVTTQGYSANQWNVFVPKPPEYEFQRDVKIRFNHKAVIQTDKADDSRKIYRVEIQGKPKNEKSFRVEVEHIFTPYYRKLTKKRPKKRHKAKSLTKEEIKSYLKTSININHQDKTFQKWIKDNKLIRKKGEGQVVFAKRVYLFIVNNFSYLYKFNMNRQCSNVSQIKKSDCGGLSILFVSCLRANGVPARLLTGRWALSAEKGKTIGDVPYHQQHVKSEFYAEDIGWIPCDISFGVEEKKNRTLWFGYDRGMFFTMHFDCDFLYDTKLFGVKKAAFIQGCHFWTRGSGLFKKISDLIDWKVKSAK